MYGICFLCLFLCGACGDEEEDTDAYPSLITELVELHTDEEGNGRFLVTDKGENYVVGNPLKGLQPSASYRLVCGFVISGNTDGAYPVVDLYTVDSVIVLAPVEDASGFDDPLKVTSIWKRGKYVNFNLSPKTQGGEHQWGYSLDEVRETETGHTYCLTLCHRQDRDPYSYSMTVYASLSLPAIGELQSGDSISVAIHTFDGRKVWRMAY